MLGEIGIFTRGSGLQKKDFIPIGVGYIHYGQIYTYYGIYAYKTKSFVSEEFAQKARKAQYGDLIIATTSENDEDVCKAVVWLGDENIAINSLPRRKDGLRAKGRQRRRRVRSRGGVCDVSAHGGPVPYLLRPHLICGIGQSGGIAANEGVPVERRHRLESANA